MISSLQTHGPRILSALALPAVLVAVAAWTEPPRAAWTAQLPYLALALGAALGARFRRSGAVLVALSLAGAWWALQAVVPGAPQALPLLALLVPVNLALLTAEEHPDLGSAPGLARLGLLGLEGVLLACVVDPGMAAALDVGLWLGPLSRPILGLDLPDLAWAAAGVVAANRLARDPGPLSGGACGLLAACALAFAAGPGPEAAWGFAAAGAVAAAALVQHSYEMAYRDELTELPGRRALNEDLARLRGRYVVAMVDVDHFKSFNDTYGHEVGDQVLRLVASRMRKAAGGGRPYRYGGEEFTVLYPGRTLDETVDALEEIRRAVEATPMVLRGPDRPKRKPRPAPGRGRAAGGRRTVTLTVSLGAAQPGGRYRTATEVLEAADRALYRAKQEGRNRVCAG